MNKKKGVCSLCNSEELVIFVEKIKEDIKTAFLIKEDWKFIKDIKDFFICPTCVFKIHLSSKIQNNFRKSKKKTRKLKQCLFCDDTDKMLFSTEDNPSDFKTHFIKFLQIFGGNERYKEVFDQSLVCSECVFAFVTWGNLRKQVYLQLNISYNDNEQDYEESSSVLVDDQDEQMHIEKSEQLRILTPQSSGDEFKEKVIHTFPRKSPNSSDYDLSRRKRRKKLFDKSQTKNRFCSLKQIISLKKIKLKRLDNVVIRDEKMFLKVPYVKIERYDQTKNDDKNVCLISDDDEDGENHLIVTPRLSPIISSLNTRLILKPHLCNICDKSFQSKCDYLSHVLKHEKFDNLIVNVTRLNLNEFALNEKAKLSTSPGLLPKECFNRILAKYLGEDSILESSFNSNLNESQQSTSEIESKKTRRRSETSSNISKKLFKFKINPNQRKLRLKKNLDDEEEEESEIVDIDTILYEEINEKMIKDNEEQETNKNKDVCEELQEDVQEDIQHDEKEMEPLRLDDDEIENNDNENIDKENENINSEKKNNETVNKEIEINETENSENKAKNNLNEDIVIECNESEDNDIEIIFDSDNGELNKDECGKTDKNKNNEENVENESEPVSEIDSLMVEVGDGDNVVTEIEEQDENLKKESKENDDSQNQNIEKDQNSSKNDTEKDSNLIEEDTREKDTIEKENTSTQQELLESEPPSPISLENVETFSNENEDSSKNVKELDKEPGTSQSPTNFKETPDSISENVEKLQSKKGSDNEDLIRDDLDESTATEIIAVENLKGLGEAVIWITDDDDHTKDGSSHSPTVNFEDGLDKNLQKSPRIDEEKEEEEIHEKETTKEVEIGEKDDDVQLKNPPIMTDEDLLNILEANISENVLENISENDQENVSKNITKNVLENVEKNAKRKREDSESDDINSNGGKRINEKLN